VNEKHEDEREAVRLLRELVVLQEMQIHLLKLILGRQMAVYPATSGGAISVS
jgi:hypothetical protein